MQPIDPDRYSIAVGLVISNFEKQRKKTNFVSLDWLVRR